MFFKPSDVILRTRDVFQAVPQSAVVRSVPKQSAVQSITLHSSADVSITFFKAPITVFSGKFTTFALI